MVEGEVDDSQPDFKMDEISPMTYTGYTVMKSLKIFFKYLMLRHMARAKLKVAIINDTSILNLIFSLPILHKNC